MTDNNFLPYVEMQTRLGIIRFLIDTGSNKNYLSPHLAPEIYRKTGPDSNIKNISGTHTVNQYVNLNPFYSHKIQVPKQKFFIFKFHEFFDGIVGYESLRSIGAIIDTTTNQLFINNQIVPMRRKYSVSCHINFLQNQCVTKILPTTVETGDFYLERDLEIAPNIFIPPGLFRAQEKKAVFPIINTNNKPVNTEIDTEQIIVEMNNFEEVQFSSKNTEKLTPLFNSLRLDHLNNEEKSKLKKLVSKYPDVFHQEGTDLSFSNVIKHEIRTTNDLPIFSKSYRYPYCHKQEVQRQINDMLAQGIIRPSTSPWVSPIWIVPKKADASG